MNAVVVIVFAIALTAVGFAHRTAPTTPAPPTPMTPEVAAYIAAGGNLSDICGLDPQGDTPAYVDCEACRIADNLAEIRSIDTEFATTSRVRSFLFIAKRIAERNELDPARLSRAPPSA